MSEDISPEIKYELACSSETDRNECKELKDHQEDIFISGFSE
jgi:hypothetical protein